MKKILNIFCIKKAFSLIELMISLITISCIIAAFTPVITKKMKNSNVTISGNNVSDITTECSDKFSSNCKLCTKSYCIQCELSSCPIGQYAESKSCSCKNCSDIFSNCSECDSTKCTKCKDNNYYINNGKCENCPTNKICDGINAYDESYCTNPPAGYYCDNNNIKKCTDKYGVYCATCTSAQCTKCINGYYKSGNQCLACIQDCITCNNSNSCVKCYSHAYLTSSGICVGCGSAIAHCMLCVSSTQCTTCRGGYYVNSSGTCSPCTDIPNCSSCDSGIKCTICSPGYYLNSNNSCSKCTITNCAICNMDGSCSSCNQGYYLSDDKKTCFSGDGKFNCSDSNFMRIGNLCITRRNMGDSTTLKIPSTVTTAQAGSEYCYSTEKCCWKGATSGTHCDSSNGDYSGCDRTLCNYAAAKEICAKFNYEGKTWRLPTASETNLWGNATVGLGSNGLMLCTQGVVSGFSYCSEQAQCKGVGKNICYPRAVLIKNGGNVTFSLGVFIPGVESTDEAYHHVGYSVRCVTEIE